MKRSLKYFILLFVIFLGGIFFLNRYSHFKKINAIKCDLTPKLELIKNKNDLYNTLGEPIYILRAEEFSQIPDTIDRFLYYYNLKVFKENGLLDERAKIYVDIETNSEKVVKYSIVRD